MIAVRRPVIRVIIHNGRTGTAARADFDLESRPPIIRRDRDNPIRIGFIWRIGRGRRLIIFPARRRLRLRVHQLPIRRRVGILRAVGNIRDTAGNGRKCIRFLLSVITLPRQRVFFTTDRHGVRLRRPTSFPDSDRSGDILFIKI